MTATRYPLLTRSQIEHWLIYHIPLKELNTSAGYWFPFRVTYQSKKHFAGSIHETPWQAYREVAQFLYMEPSAREELTNLYYNS